MRTLRSVALIGSAVLFLLPAAGLAADPQLDTLMKENASLKARLSEVERQVQRLASPSAGSPSARGAASGKVDAANAEQRIAQLEQQLAALRAVIQVGPGGVVITSKGSLALDSKSNLTLKSGGTATLEASSHTTIQGAQVRIGGAEGKPAARRGDPTANGVISNGSSKVLIQ